MVASLIEAAGQVSGQGLLVAATGVLVELTAGHWQVGAGGVSVVERRHREGPRVTRVGMLHGEIGKEGR